MVVGAMLALVFSLLTRIIVPRIGETRAVYLGLACGTIGFMGYAFAAHGWELYAWMAVWVLMGLSGPSLNAIMSKQVGPSEQGELQGALASLGSLTSVAAPPLLSNLFGYFTSAEAPIYFPGSAFFAASLCLALAHWCLLGLKKYPRMQSHKLKLRRQVLASTPKRAMRLTNSGGISVARPVSAEMKTNTCFTLMRNSP
jgi:MFS family permease